MPFVLILVMPTASPLHAETASGRTAAGGNLNGMEFTGALNPGLEKVCGIVDKRMTQLTDAKVSRSDAAVLAVRTGARECQVTLAYAPNRDVPLDVRYDMAARGERRHPAWFAHSAVRERYVGGSFTATPARSHWHAMQCDSVTVP